MNNNDIALELSEIHEKMCELLERAEHLVKQTGDKHLLNRCRAYWIGAMDNALGNPINGALKGFFTIDRLSGEDEETDDLEDGC